MRASKIPIHGPSTSLFLSIYAVVFMVFCLKAQVRPKVTQDFIPVLPEVGLLYLSAATAMESQSPSFLGLELSLPLQACCLISALATLTCFSVQWFVGLGHLSGGPLLRLLDAL